MPCLINKIKTIHLSKDILKEFNHAKAYTPVMCYGHPCAKFNFDISRNSRLKMDFF